MLEQLLARSVPSQLFVLPQDRSAEELNAGGGGGSPTTNSLAGLSGGTFELKETIVVPNLGFTKQSVKTNG